MLRGSAGIWGTGRQTPRKDALVLSGIRGDPPEVSGLSLSWSDVPHTLTGGDL